MLYPTLDPNITDHGPGTQAPAGEGSASASERDRAEGDGSGGEGAPGLGRGDRGSAPACPSSAASDSGDEGAGERQTLSRMELVGRTRPRARMEVQHSARLPQHHRTLVC